MLIFFALELASATFACLMQLTLPSVYITTAALCSSPFRQQSFLPFAQFCGMAPSALYLHFDTAWGYYYYWRGRRGELAIIVELFRECTSKTGATAHPLTSRGAF